MEKKMSIETMANLKMMLSSQIKYLSVKRGITIAGSGDFRGYGNIKILNSLGIFEMFFFANETSEYGNEILGIELKQSDDKEFFDKSFPLTIDLQRSYSEIVKIEIYGEKYFIRENVVVDTDYLVIFEDSNQRKFSIESSGVFNDEFAITFDEKEIKNKFDLKRDNDLAYFSIQVVLM